MVVLNTVLSAAALAHDVMSCRPICIWSINLAFLTFETDDQLRFVLAKRQKSDGYEPVNIIYCYFEDEIQLELT